MTRLQRLTAEGMQGPARIVPVILCGGAGTRLWPLSTPERPKPMQRLAGPDTMLQATARRTLGPDLFKQPMIVAAADHAAEIEAQAAAVGVAPARLILEPEGRNTAAAIAAAALEAEPDDLLLVMPSDHFIGDPLNFLTAVAAAAPLAAEDWLVTFGIRPTAPETGYGYIRRGEAIGPGIFRADRFVEKPGRETAEALLADGLHSWNAGIFLFRAGAVRAALGVHAADIFAAVERAIAAAVRSGSQVRLETAAFAGARSQSIDHAVMEKAERIAVVPVDMGWSDLGSWDSLYDVGSRDEDGNVSAGEAVPLDARNCLLHSEGPTIVALGVDDLVVVATPDAVLVARRGDTQRVREAVERLKARARPEQS